MTPPSSQRPAAFSLFETLIALGVFAVAFGGIALAIDSALSASLEARSLAEARRLLESRLAYCLADPPAPGASREVENDRFKIRESATPFEATNAAGEPVTGIVTVRIEVEADGITSRAEVLLSGP